MFKNRSLQVRVVKNTKQETATEAKKPFISHEEKEILKEMLKGTVIAIVTVMAASVVLHTAAELIVQAAESDTEDED